MTVSQMAQLPPAISGVATSPSAQTAGVSLEQKNGFGTTPSTDTSFSPEAMHLYAQFVGASQDSDFPGT
jgi:hypothetical protein